MLNEYINILKGISNHRQADFLSDPILRGAAERYLQLAIETCINIGNRILSLEQFNKKFKTPETYAEIFENLAKIDILDSQFAEELVRMAKFRNKLVHVYWELKPELIYALLQTRVDDFIKYLTVTTEYLEK